jgi:hypothetical protein
VAATQADGIGHQLDHRHAERAFTGHGSLRIISTNIE